MVEGIDPGRLGQPPPRIGPRVSIACLQSVAVAGSSVHMVVKWAAGRPSHCLFPSHEVRLAWPARAGLVSRPVPSAKHVVRVMLHHCCSWLVLVSSFIVLSSWFLFCVIVGCLLLGYCLFAAGMLRTLCLLLLACCYVLLACCLLATCLLLAGCWLVAVECWSLVVGCWLLARRAGLTGSCGLWAVGCGL